MRKYFKSWGLILLLWAMATVCAAKPVQIGVLTFLSKPETLVQWKPTARQLEKDIPSSSFQIVPLTYPELSSAIKNAEVDFVLTNPEHYVVMRNAYRLSPMVTLNTVVEKRVFAHFGSAIFTRSENAINTISEIRGHTVAAVDLYSLGGFLMAADVFHQNNIDLRSSDVRRLKFVGLPHSLVVQEVMSGQSDVGIVRTGVLERMAHQGQLDMSQVKILNAQPKTLFPQALSTDLYPEWPWAALPHNDPALIKAVTLSLLTFQSDSEAAVTGRFNSFSPPANYGPVEELMRRLNVYPGAEAKPLWEQLWISYEHQIKNAALVLVCLGFLLTAYLLRSNRRLREMTQLYQQAQSVLQVTAAAFESQVGLIVTDKNTCIIRANQAFCNMLGYSETLVQGLSTFQLRGSSVSAGTLGNVWADLQANGGWRGELMCRHQAGYDVPCMVTITAIREAHIGLSGYVGSFEDISRQKKSEAEIRQLAFFDVLTELPNRRFFLERLQQVESASVQTGQLGALLFIDLDHFKVLNDTHGHTVGDQLLKKISQRLMQMLGPQLLTARLGGDEFVVMLADLGTNAEQAMQQAMEVATKVREAILAPYQLSTCGDLADGEHALRYTCSGSIGVALFGQKDEPVTEALKRADVAMYQAKLGGRNAICKFDPEVQRVLNQQAALSSDLNLALLDKQLVMYYQMQVDIHGRPVGAECLLRWKHPGRGAVPPAEFIPLAEESGTIVAMGDWVIGTACNTLVSWASTPSRSELTLSVNVSPRQFIESDFVSKLAMTIERTGVRPELLRLEITEGIVLHNTDQVIEKMHQLCAMGLSFSIDDFGTGYSSLSYLQRLPLREVKIDKAFVFNLMHDTSSEAIVRAIIALSASLNISVVSEGVETPEQRDQLIAMGCDLLQGFFISRPMELDALERLLV